MAFSIRLGRENAPPLVTIPRSAWAMIVITPDAVLSATNGSFSAIRFQKTERRPAAETSEATRNLASGQKSTKKRTKGKTTIAGLHIKPTANKASAAKYQPERPVLPYLL